MREILEQIKKAKTYEEKMMIVEMLELRNLADKKYPNYIIERIKNAIEDEEFLRYLIEEDNADEAPEEVSNDTATDENDNNDSDDMNDDNDDDFDFGDDSDEDNDNDYDDNDDNDNDDDDFDFGDDSDEDDNKNDLANDTMDDVSSNNSKSDILMLVDKLSRLIEQGNLNEVEKAAIKSLPKLIK